MTKTPALLCNQFRAELNQLIVADKTDGLLESPANKVNSVILFTRAFAASLICKYQQDVGTLELAEHLKR